MTPGPRPALAADDGLVEESGRLRTIALEAARESAEHLLPAFRSTMSVSDKGGRHDLVTEHDHISEGILRRAILEREPDGSVLGEEGGVSGSGRIEWHVDPIDGTVNFANGIPWWCVSVAAVLDGVVVAGAVLHPSSGTEFSVDLGGMRVDGQPVVPRPASEERRGDRICTFPREPDLRANGEAAVGAAGRLSRSYGAVRSMGSGALGLAHVAAGWGDATFDLHTNSWDVAAGSLMIRAVGGRYVGLQGGVPDEDPRTAFRRPGYYALGPGVDHQTLREVTTSLSADASGRGAR